jgi:hypothetical protein
MRLNDSCVVGLLTAAALGCGTHAPTQTVTIAAVIDQTSTTAWTSWPIVGNMALDQLNSALEASNNPIRFVLDVSDTQQTATVAVAQAQAAAAAGAKAIISDTTANGDAIGKLMYDGVASDAINIPITCVTCTGPQLDNPNATNSDPIEQASLQDAQHWRFRTVNRGTEQTMVLKNIILARGPGGDVNNDGKFKVTVVALNDNSGHGFVASVLSLFSAVAPNVIVEKITIQGANVDVNDNAFWDTVAASVIDNNSDCIQDPSTVTGCLPAVMGDGFPDALMENLNPGYNIALSQALARAQNSITFFHAHAFRATQVAAILRSAIDGQQGVSAILADESSSGMQFVSDLTTLTGAGPTLLDSAMYDAVVLNALAVLKASVGLADARDVAGADVRAAMEELHDPTGQTVGAGRSEFVKTIGLIKSGASFNYSGASGPTNFDASGNVVVRLSLYEGQNGVFVDNAIFDCIPASTSSSSWLDPSTLTCPQEP